MNFDLANLIVAVTFGTLGFFGGRAAERRQYRLSASGFASVYFRVLRAWASEAIDVLTEAAYCAQGRADSAPPDNDACFRCRHQLSALVDRGRFFIPNYNPEEVGAHKAAAYRGLRHPALDYLVAAEQVLAGTSPELARFPSHRAALIEIKREFVSQIQDILDPRTQNKELANLLRDARGDPGEKRTALERLSQNDHPDFSEE